MKVSVLLPTFNRRQFLSEAIACIRAQTMTDWELVVVDDGSTDGSGELLSELIRDMPQPYRYVWQENRGVGAARGRLLELAKGDYIAFYDSDDLWAPFHLQVCCDCMDQHDDIDWVKGGGIQQDEAGTALIKSIAQTAATERMWQTLAHEQREPFTVLTDARMPTFLLEHGLLPGLQASVIRKSALRGISFPDVRIGEDLVFTFRALCQGMRLAFSPQVHVTYRRHDGQTSAPGHKPYEKQLWACLELNRSVELLLSDPLPARHRNAVRRRLADREFWALGYGLYLPHERHSEAFSAMWRGFCRAPHLSKLKALVIQAARLAIRKMPGVAGKPRQPSTPARTTND